MAHPGGAPQQPRNRPWLPRPAAGPARLPTASPEVETSGTVVRCTSRAPPPPHWPWLSSVALGGVVGSFSQGHADGHLLVAMPLAEPSLSPPLDGSRSCVFNIRHDVAHEAT